MKKEVSLLMFLAFILVFTTRINAQQKSQLVLNGTKLLIPYSTSVPDTTKWLKLGVGKDAFMKIERLICIKKDCQIISYTFAVAINGDIVSTKCSGNVLTPELKKTLIHLNSGSKVWIENITFKGPDGKEGKLKNVFLKIE